MFRLPMLKSVAYKRTVNIRAGPQNNESRRPSLINQDYFYIIWSLPPNKTLLQTKYNDSFQTVFPNCSNCSKWPLSAGKCTHTQNAHKNGSAMVLLYENNNKLKLLTWPPDSPSLNQIQYLRDYCSNKQVRSTETIQYILTFRK